MSDIEELEDHIKDCQKVIELAEAYERLKQNNDFKLVFNEHIYEKYLIRNVELLSRITNRDAREGVINSIQSVSNLWTIFAEIEHNGEMAEVSIEEARETVDAINQENI